MEAVSNGGSLRGCVTVVAGATRGAGRGIAAALGEAGAIVICTGRSTARADASTASDYDRPETIEETAELVTSLGGVGVPIAVDHLDTGQVAALAERIRSEYGRIDVLVNDIWGAERLKGGPRDWNTPLWKLDLQRGLRILRLGIETHLVTSHYLLPLLITQPGGLLVEVTDGTAEYKFVSLPDFSVRRPRQAERESFGLLSGSRTRAARRDGRGNHAGLAAFGNDARQFRCHGCELARRVERQRERSTQSAAGFRSVGIAPLYRAGSGGGCI